MKRYILRMALFFVALTLTNILWGQTWRDLPAPTKADDYSLSTGYYKLKSEGIKLSNAYRYKISNGEDITIDLNGATFDANGKDIALFSMEGGTLTIIDNSPNKTGKIKGTRKTCFFVSPSSNQYATLNIEGGTIEDCQPSDGEGGAIEINDRGTVNMRDGVIRNCRASQGAGVYVNGGIFNMTDGKITENKIFSLTGTSGQKDNPDWNHVIHESNINPNNDLPIGINSKTSYKGAIDSERSDGHYEYKGGGVYVESGIFNMSGGEISKNVSINGGGVYVVNGATFNLSGGTIVDNYASSASSGHGNGGGIYIKKDSRCTITGDSISPIEISGNRVTRYGGGIYIDGSTMTVTNCNVAGNYASSGGGIAQAKSGNDQCQMTLENSDVTSNWAKGVSSDIHKGGGGIFVLNGTLISENSNIKTNHSTENGGAFYVNNGNITLTKTNLEENTANSGGAIALMNGTLISNNSNIKTNHSVGNGGAFYVSGGNITLTETNLEENTANSGGAIALMNGRFSIDEESVINKNTATEYGGGLYVSNTTTSEKAITCTGGSFKNNTAKNGGGIYVAGNPSNANGKINLTFAANVEGNIASNGGGIYMSDRVTMTFGDGLIRSNSAIQPVNDSKKYETANKKNADSVAGVGGGIFMADNSTLSFSSPKMGIYGNSATNAGADICANGNGTTINLPNITGMDLKGFDVIGNDLYWVEDYFNGDSQSNTLSGLTGVRYEAALIQGLETQNYILSFTSSNPRKLTNYLCLDLGYDLVFVTFEPVGLDGDEIIMLDYPEKNTDNGNRVFTSPLHYRKVSFTSEEPKVVGLPSGYWKIRDMGWNYKCEIKTYTDLTNTVQYDKSKVDSELAQSDYVEVSKTQKKVIVYFDSKGGAEYIKESQHSKVNKMKVKK